jgi:ribA/ribD-fused uncharacterized protein
MSKIDRFIGQYSFLSNFHSSTIVVDGKKYPTVEHAYQAHKATTESEREVIRCAKDPMEAKRLGKTLVLPEDWETQKVDIMKKLIRKKFENPLLRELLKATGDLNLIHDNRFNDRFWGMCRGSGNNWLGVILEEVRREIFCEDGAFFDDHNVDQV